MTNQEERSFRITEILKAIPNLETEKEKFVAKQMIKWGFSRRTTLEYLNCLIAAGHVKEEEGFIWRK